MLSLPRDKPVSRRPWRTAATKWPDSSAQLGLRKPTTGIADCCACPASGQSIGEVTTPPINLINSRRLMGFPVPRVTPGVEEYHILRSRIARWAILKQVAGYVRFGSKADIQAAFGYYCWWARVLKFVEHHP